MQIMDELAAEHGFRYDVRTADIDEKAIRHDDPHQLVLALGRAKRDAILAKMRLEDSEAMTGPQRATFLITCDQVVVHEGQIREKPESDEECRRFIESVPSVSGRAASLHDTAEVVNTPSHSSLLQGLLRHSLQHGGQRRLHKRRDGLELRGGGRLDHPHGPASP